MNEPVSLTFIFQTIGVIVLFTALFIVLIKTNKRSKTSKENIEGN